MMNLRHLEIFYNIMLYGSLTEAAAVLCVSQPAASKLLKHAEQRVGFRLFHRIKGKLHATDEAHILYEQIKPIYDQLNELNKLTLNLAKNPQGMLSIGCLPSLGLSLMPKITALFLKDYPYVFLKIGTDHTQVLQQKILRREIDLALTFEPVLQHGITATKIVDIPLVYIDANPSPLLQSIAQIDENRWIHPDADSLLTVLNPHRVFQSSLLNVETYYMVAELVRQGIGCSITDIYSAAHTLPLHMIHGLKPELSMTIYVLQNAGVSSSKVSDDFIHLLQQKIQDITPSLNQRL